MSGTGDFFIEISPLDSIVWMMLNTFSDIVSPFAPEEILITLSGSGAVIFLDNSSGSFSFGWFGPKGGK